MPYRNAAYKFPQKNMSQNAFESLLLHIILPQHVLLLLPLISSNPLRATLVTLNTLDSESVRWAKEKLFGSYILALPLD